MIRNRKCTHDTDASKHDRGGQDGGCLFQPEYGAGERLPSMGNFIFDLI